MSSQLNVDTIVDKAGSGGTNVKVANTSTYVSDGGAVTQNTVQGLAKSWAYSTVAASLTDSFNTSGGTDNGTGNYTISFTNSFSNANYSVVITHEHGGAGGQTSNAYFQTIATGSFISHHEGVASGSSTNHGARDFINCSQVTGDLA